MSTRLTTPALPTYSLFQSAEGGVIFYLDSSKSHGLAVATADIAGQQQWDSGAGSYTGAILTELSQGFQNTELIIQALGINAQAASSCAGYSSTFSGWYLPSLQELNQLYFLQTQIGGFDNTAAYWSSTESGTQAIQAVAQIFNPGGVNQIAANKTSAASIRCIRAF